jgi:hypothetical protein
MRISRSDPISFFPDAHTNFLDPLTIIEESEVLAVCQHYVPFLVVCTFTVAVKMRTFAISVSFLYRAIKVQLSEPCRTALSNVVIYWGASDWWLWRRGRRVAISIVQLNALFIYIQQKQWTAQRQCTKTTYKNKNKWPVQASTKCVHNI